MKKQLKSKNRNFHLVKIAILGLVLFILVGCQQINDLANGNGNANSNGNMNANANSNDGKNMNANVNSNTNENRSSSENTIVPESVQKDNLAKQKQTIGDIRLVGTSMFSWLTDQVGNNLDPGFRRPHTPEISPRKANFVVQNTETRNYQTERSNVKQPAYLYAQEKKEYNIESVPLISYEELKKLLEPMYMEKIPEKDAWGNPYEYRLNVKDPLARQVMVIRSPGRDGKYENSIYQLSSFTPDNFDEDIVWADGFFVRWAQHQPSS